MVGIPNGALIVIADGVGARFLRNDGSAESLLLRQEGHLSLKDPADGGPSGHRPEEQSAQQSIEATFSKQLAHALHEQSLSGTYETLVLVADPQSLGQIRGILDASVKAKLILILNKELSRHSLKDIAELLTRASQDT